MIAWIIERMELEQARMEYEQEAEEHLGALDGEGEGGGEDGEEAFRPMSGGEDGEGGDMGAGDDMSLEYLLHRHPYARSGGIPGGTEGLRAYALAHSSNAEVANALADVREGPDLGASAKSLLDLLGPAPERLRGCDDGSWRTEVTYAPVLLSAHPFSPTQSADRRYRPGKYVLLSHILKCLWNYERSGL